MAKRYDGIGEEYLNGVKRVLNAIKRNYEKSIKGKEWNKKR